MIDLQGRVLEADALIEHPFQFPPDCVTVIAQVHEDVGDRRGEAGTG